MLFFLLFFFSLPRGFEKKNTQQKNINLLASDAHHVFFQQQQPENKKNETLCSPKVVVIQLVSRLSMYIKPPPAPSFRLCVPQHLLDSPGIASEGSESILIWQYERVDYDWGRLPAPLCEGTAWVKGGRGGGGGMGKRKKKKKKTGASSASASWGCKLWK